MGCDKGPMESSSGQLYLDTLFPRLALGSFPTPLQHLPRLGAALGHDALYVKRDDLSGLSLGGNKTRSLEYLLGDALRQGADTIVTAGGLQSNLCSLTAAACAKAGLRCVLVHNDDRPRLLDGNMLLNHLFGAVSVFIGRKSEEERAVEVERQAAALRTVGARPYVIHNGASVPMGALGYANAALELHQQSMEMGLVLCHVAIVGAMGGTASGFLFGASLLKEPFHVHVLSVEYPREELRRRMSGLLSGITDLTGLRPRHNPWDVATIHDEYLGGGYGIPTEESLEALRLLPETEGIFLENVYTAKTVAGFMGLVRRGIIPRDEAGCFIHTGGMAALFAQRYDSLGMLSAMVKTSSLGKT
ncbi:MAG: 1-aminocyclopropane-1-carboxylate deaminase/D-cysteine desulfhydrase [Bacillota bacterium]